MGKPTNSAGGIVVTGVAGQAPLILIVERYRDLEPQWQPVLRQLPKGGCRPGENLEETALREVLEETGYQAEILDRGGEAHWSYERFGITWDETVHYYLMRPVDPGADPASLSHDDEFDAVRWVPVSEAVRSVSYPEERRILSSPETLSAIARWFPGS